MWNDVPKREAPKVLKDGRVLWGIVLIKGDTLYTYAYDIGEAYKNIFGENLGLCACIRAVMRLDEPPEGNLTFYGK